MCKRSGFRGAFFHCNNTWKNKNARRFRATGLATLHLPTGLKTGKIFTYGAFGCFFIDVKIFDNFLLVEIEKAVIIFIQ